MADIHVLSKYNEIADSAKSDGGPFRQLAEFYCFCAHLAFIKGGKVPEVKISSKEDRQVRDTVLNNAEYKNQIDTLALAVTKDYTILMETDEAISKRYKIFQNYVNHGLKLISQRRKKLPTDINGLDTVLEILREQSAQNKKINPVNELDPDVKF
jgi:dnd system-associated protein 4